MPALELNFDYSQYFPIYGPLGARIGGSIGATADFAFGFDTFGLREYFKTDSVVDILDGFYVSDMADVLGTGPDVPELTLSGSLTAAAEINVAIASVGVGGGVFADIYFDLHDNDQDGRVRAGEIVDNLRLGPLYVFDVGGRLSGKLFAYYQIGVGPFGIRGEYELAEVVLLEYSSERPDPESIPDMGDNSTSDYAFLIDDFENLEPLPRTLQSAEDEAWFTFTMDQQDPDLAIGILNTDVNGASTFDAVLVMELFSEADLQNPIATMPHATGDASVELDLGSLTTGTYYVKV